MLDFDENVGHFGLAEAARSARPDFTCRTSLVYGAANLPTGSYLALSNHPGMTDTLVLFAALRRADLRRHCSAAPVPAFAGKREPAALLPS